MTVDRIPRPSPRTPSRGELYVEAAIAARSMSRQKSPASSWKQGRLIRAPLDLGDVFSLKALRSLLDLELHKLSFVERFVSIHLNGGKVNENVFPGLALDEAKSLRCIEPLHHTLFSSQSDDSSAVMSRFWCSHIRPAVRKASRSAEFVSRRERQDRPRRADFCTNRIYLSR
jgi:hypothetical protein